MPVCPAGGTYKITWVVGGETPECSKHGDVLGDLYHVRTIIGLDREFHKHDTNSVSAKLVMYGRHDPLTNDMPAAATAFIKGVVTSTPDEDVFAAMPLEPVCVIDLMGHRYALEHDEILEMFGLRTTTWKLNGVKNRIFKEAHIR